MGHHKGRDNVKKRISRRKKMERLKAEQVVPEQVAKK